MENIMLSILLGLCGGAGMPMQTSINARLVKRAGTPFTAAMINFLVGTAVLICIASFTEHSRGIPFDAISDAPPWLFLGGCFAAEFISANILMMPRLGSIQTVILPALGQLAMGMIIDQFGLFGAQQKPISSARIIGVLLVLTGVIIIVLAKASHTDGENNTAPPQKNLALWRLLGLVTGMCMASQTAVNGRLGLVVDSRVMAATVNFMVGTVILLIINLFLIRKIRSIEKVKGGPAWMWIGGLFGDLYVIANIISAQTVGTAMAVVFVLTGMMTGGLLVDHFGIFHAVRRKITGRKILGVVLMAAGIAVFQLM